MVDVALRSYFQTPANEPKLTNPNEVHEAIRSFRFDGAPGPNGIPNRALEHLTKAVASLLVQIVKAVLLTHHFPFCVEARLVTSILTSGNDPALPSS
jgi:hypothetical protein